MTWKDSLEFMNLLYSLKIWLKLFLFINWPVDSVPQKNQSLSKSPISEEYNWVFIVYQIHLCLYISKYAT